MTGSRKPKKLTAKEALARNEVLERENTMLRLDIRQRRIDLLENLWTLEEVFSQFLDQAASIREAKTWYKEYQDKMEELHKSGKSGIRSELVKSMAEINIYLDGLPDFSEYIDELDAKS